MGVQQVVQTEASIALSRANHGEAQRPAVVAVDDSSPTSVGQTQPYIHKPMVMDTYDPWASSSTEQGQNHMQSIPLPKWNWSFTEPSGGPADV